MLSAQKQYPPAQAELLGCSFLLFVLAPLVLHMPGQWSPAFVHRGCSLCRQGPRRRVGPEVGLCAGQDCCSQLGVCLPVFCCIYQASVFSCLRRLVPSTVQSYLTMQMLCSVLKNMHYIIDHQNSSGAADQVCVISPSDIRHALLRLQQRLRKPTLNGTAPLERCASALQHNCSHDNLFMPAHEGAPTTQQTRGYAY